VIGDNFELIQDDIRDLVLAEKFDFVYSIGTLGEYTALDAYILNKVIGWLKPNGFLFFTVVDSASYAYPSSQGMRQFLIRFATSVLRNVPHSVRSILGGRFMDTEDWKHLFLSRSQIEELLKTCSQNIAFELDRAWDGKHAHHLCKIWLNGAA